MAVRGSHAWAVAGATLTSTARSAPRLVANARRAVTLPAYTRPDRRAPFRPGAMARLLPGAARVMDEKPAPEPWRWDESTWRGHVDRVRAGRSLAPTTWPGGARVAVGLSFDSDHETIPLRDGETRPGR